MKKILFWILFLMYSLPGFSQDITHYKLKFFTLRNSKLSLGLGGDVSESAWFFESSRPSGLKVNNNYKNVNDTDSLFLTYLSAGLTFDFHSHHSRTGLIFGANYSLSRFSVPGLNSNRSDYFSVQRLEIPAHIRIRTGSRDAVNYAFFMLGGSLSLPVSGQRQFVDPNTWNYDVLVKDKSRSQFNTLYTLSACIAQTAFGSKANNSRATIWISGEYPLKSSVNNKYTEFLPGGNSILADYENFNLRQFRLGLGLRYFIGLRKYKV